VPKNVKRQGDIAIHDILDRLHRRQNEFGLLATATANNNNIDDDAQEQQPLRAAVVVVVVHHQGMTAELRREILGPHVIRQRHGNANLHHG